MAASATAPPPAVVASSSPNVVAAAVSASLNPPYGLLPAAAAAALSSAEAHAAAASSLRINTLAAETATAAGDTVTEAAQAPAAGGRQGGAAAATAWPWCNTGGPVTAAAPPVGPASRAKPTGEHLQLAAANPSSAATGARYVGTAAAGPAAQRGVPAASSSLHDAHSRSISSSACVAASADGAAGRCSVAGDAAAAAGGGAAGGGRRSYVGSEQRVEMGGETTVSPCAPVNASSVSRPLPGVLSSSSAECSSSAVACRPWIVSSSSSSSSCSSSSSSSRPAAAGPGRAAGDKENGRPAEATEIRNSVLPLHRQERQPGGLPLAPTSSSSSQQQQVQGEQRYDQDLQQLTLDLAPAVVGYADAPQMLFIFINPTSGGNRAAAFTESGVCRMTLTTPFLCNMYIFDIREGKTGEKPGFLLLKAATEMLDRRHSNDNVEERGGAAATAAAADAAEAVQQGGGQREAPQQRQDPCGGASTERDAGATEDVIRVLVAGGDGTVMWVAMEAEAHHIDLQKIAVGVIPYGTGNDFATAFGWKQIRGLRPFDVAMRTMRSLMVRWSDARVVHHDLWSVFVALSEDGCFTRINSRSRKKEVLRDETGETKRTMSLMMSNYFSIGVESRIGRGFDRHRGRSRFVNKLTYGVEGFKVACFKRTATIEQIVEALFEKPGEPDEEVIFRTRGSQVTHGPFLKKAMSLILCNIPSFSSGNDIWGNSHHVGFVVKKRGTQQWGKRAEAVINEKQFTGDGELEFLSFPSAASLGLEFACHGRARRLHQGSGPWKLTFKDLPLATKVYFQVDGEFFQMKRPLHVMVKHSRTVKVLASRFDRHLHA